MRCSTATAAWSPLSPPRAWRWRGGTRPLTPTRELSTAVLSPGYIAQGGLELGYALTAHKAEGLDRRRHVGHGRTAPATTAASWSTAPGMDNPGLYVSLSRDKGQVMLFGARAELEGEREELVYGPPRNQQELTDRVIAALAERAAATATTRTTARSWSTSARLPPTPPVLRAVPVPPPTPHRRYQYRNRVACRASNQPADHQPVRPEPEPDQCR